MAMATEDGKNLNPTIRQVSDQEDPVRIARELNVLEDDEIDALEVYDMIRHI